MALKVNPDVGELSPEELAGAADMPLLAVPEPDYEPVEETPELETSEDIESEEPEPTAKDESPTNRTEQTSRRQGKTAPKKGINLDEYEEGRALKATHQKQLAAVQKEATEAKKRADAAEARAAAQENAQREAQTQAMERQLDDVVDPAERSRLIQQISYSHFQALQNYDAEVRRTVASEGLSESDYPSQKYLGPDGRTRLMVDISTAKAKALAKENEELKKSASPEAINAQVQAIVAKALQQAGLNHVDAGETVTAPRGGTSDEEKALWRQVQAGSKRAETEYKKRFGAG